MFLDEGGNLDFSSSGTRYFALTGVRLTRPFPCDLPLLDLRFDLIESGIDIEYFHAAEDRQATRDRVFGLIRTDLHRFVADSVIVEKGAVELSLRDDAAFYPKMLGLLLRHVVEGASTGQWSEIIVITDRIPVNRKRRAIEKAVKITLAGMLPDGMRYRVLHHDSKSCGGLQVADYFNWAVYRSWDRNDHRSLDLIRPAVRSQIPIPINGDETRSRDPR